MLNFHEHKLWQDAFVILMDIHDIIDDSQLKTGDSTTALLVAAQNVASKIADGLSRADRRLSRDLIYEAVGLVAVARTQLAVVWGRGDLDDDTFKSIDNKYETLSQALQNYK